MKALLCLIFPIILLVGYGQPDLDDPKVLDEILDEAVHLNSLQRKGSRGKESFYDPNKDNSYIGWAKLMHPNGKLHFLMYLNNELQLHNYQICLQNILLQSRLVILHESICEWDLML